jgi:hypothetical protein
VILRRQIEPELFPSQELLTTERQTGNVVADRPNFTALFNWHSIVIIIILGGLEIDRNPRVETCIIVLR